MIVYIGFWPPRVPWLVAVLAVRRARLMAVEDPAPVGAPSISKALKLN